MLGVIRVSLTVSIYRNRAELNERIGTVAVPLHDLYPLPIFPIVEPRSDLVSTGLNVVVQPQTMLGSHRLAMDHRLVG